MERHGTTKDKEGWTYITLQEAPKKRIDFMLYRGPEFIMKDVSVLENVSLDTIEWTDRLSAHLRFRLDSIVCLNFFPDFYCSCILDQNHPVCLRNLQPLRASASLCFHNAISMA